MSSNNSWRSISVLIVFLLLMCLQSSTVSLPNSVWSTAEVLSTESTSSSYRPSIVIDSQDHIHVAWYDPTNYLGSGSELDIFYKFWNSTSLSWSTTEVVSTESTENSRMPSLAIDSKDNIHVAWEDYSDYLGAGEWEYDIFYKFRNATSQSWSTTEVVSTESSDQSYFPSLAIDSKDNVHVAWEDYSDYLSSGFDNDIFYKFWNATSLSWNTTQVVSTESTSFSYRPSLAIDSKDNVHVGWDDYSDYLGAGGTDYDIFYKLWNATSQSWSITQVVSTESTSTSWRASLAIDNKDNVHVAWEDDTDYLGAGGTDYDIFYRFWNATSHIWNTTQVVSTESTLYSEFPSLAIDSKDNIHVAWQDRTDYLGSGTERDIFYKLLNAKSQSWSTTEVVSTESSLDSYNPRLAIDAPDNVHVAWEDNTEYLGSGTDRDIFYKIGVTLDSLSQTVTSTETETETETNTETETETETETNTETETETSTETNTETETGPTSTETSTVKNTETVTGPTETVTQVEVIYNSSTITLSDVNTAPFVFLGSILGLGGTVAIYMNKKSP